MRRAWTRAQARPCVPWAVLVATLLALLLWVRAPVIDSAPLSTTPPPTGPCGTIVTAPLHPRLMATACSSPHHLRGHEAHSVPLFVAVTSPVVNVGLRARRRAEWLSNPNMRHLFFVGLSDLPEEQLAIRKEMEEFGDVVQLHHYDTYSNLTLKSVFSAVWWHEWHAHLLPAESARPFYWLKVEDYMANSFEDILGAVALDTKESGGRPSRLYSGGAIFGGNGVMRNGRWGCPERFCPYDKYPTKYAGGQYLLGSAAVAALREYGPEPLVHNGIEDVYPIEDHFVASILASRNITVKRDKAVWWKGPPLNPPYVKKHGDLCFLEHRD
eukprot:m.104655 g.104655  ORF g.104655 m.104655 type:complete len:327 (+) comp9109_c0_seq1:1374-2354(+)